MVRTIVGSFDSRAEAGAVVEALQRAGIAGQDISMVASGPGGSAPPAGPWRAPTPDNDVGSSPGPGGAHAEAISATPHRSYATADTAQAASDGGGLVGLRTEIDDAPDDAPAETGPGTAGAAAMTGGMIGGVAGLALAFTSLTVPVLGPIIAAGPIVALLAGAGAGAVAGGLVGSLGEMGVAPEHAGLYAEHLRRGGALVVVRAGDARMSDVTRIMQRGGAIDINKRADTWRSSGWEGFDESAKPYTVADLEREARARDTDAPPPAPGAPIR
jgi:hypothetical protein